jgi:protein HIRA/HIR1
MDGHTIIESPNSQSATPSENKSIDPSVKSTTDTNFTSSSGSSSSTINEQKVTIAKNGKKRIQPIAISSSSTTTTNTSTAIQSQNKVIE